MLQVLGNLGMNQTNKTGRGIGSVGRELQLLIALPGKPSLTKYHSSLVTVCNMSMPDRGNTNASMLKGQ
jgi:hypothetical protein